MDRKEYNRQYYLKHRDELKKRHYEHFKAHREEYRKNSLKWHHDHKIYKPKKRAKTNQERCREYYQRNKDILNKKRAIYHRERRARDQVFKMKYNVRNLVRISFRRHGIGKSKKTEEIVGCSLDFLHKYLLETWKKNYKTDWSGEPYHIDHIVPLVTANTEEDIIKLCHYTNLQMLKPKDNIRKGGKTY